MRCFIVDKGNLRVAFSAPLHTQDTESQTYGCRQSNPDICANNGLAGLCAFERDDGVCLRPSRAWKKKYIDLKEKNT